MQTAATREGPERTCVGCRARVSTADLLRVVVREGALVCDLRGRLPGRGAWLHPDRECLHKAERRRAFRRALRIPQDSAPLDVTGLAEHLATVTRTGVGGSRASMEHEEAGRPVMSQP